MMKKVIFTVILSCSMMCFIQSQDWQTDFETAKELAEDGNRPVVLVFQGSDWCAPCIKLDREIWSSETFRDYAREHFVMLKADFPRRKKNALSEDQAERNAELAEKYNPHGIFPLVLVLDEEGSVLGTTGYEKMSPHAYIELLQSFLKPERSSVND